MRKRLVLVTLMGLLMSFGALLGGQTKSHSVTIKGVITNLAEANDLIAKDTFLQLALLGPGGSFKIHTDGRGRFSIDSDLPRISMPVTGSKGAFSFDCKGLDEGTYVVAFQLGVPSAVVLGAGVAKVLNYTALLFKGGRPLQIQISKDTGSTVDVGEVTLPTPRR